MLARTKLVFQYASEEEASQVAYLLELDNRIAPRGLKVKTEKRGRDVVSYVEHSSAGTLFATIDDLLFCEKLVSEILRL
ncbi:KEOPS complex subunit Pcc1 [Candidatus Pyrohabitans sp.]